MSVPSINITDDVASYAVNYYSDQYCQDLIPSLKFTKYLDLNIQCGQQRFYVAYPNGLQIDSNKDSGSDDNINWWLILIISVAGISAIVIALLIYYRRKRNDYKSGGRPLSNAILSDFN